MPTTKCSQSVKGNIQALFFHHDPETRGLAAENLGNGTMGVASERAALEALTTALRDPANMVKDAALQSLVRLGVK
ncbi:HEAT repeat domain-containing protein [Nitrospira sp. M1]